MATAGPRAPTAILSPRLSRRWAPSRLVVRPEQFDTSQGLHRIDRRGRARIDWRIRHAQYIDIWDARRDLIVHGDPILRGRSYTDDYMT